MLKCRRAEVRKSQKSVSEIIAAVENWVLLRHMLQPNELSFLLALCFWWYSAEKEQCVDWMREKSIYFLQFEVKVKSKWENICSKKALKKEQRWTCAVVEWTWSWLDHHKRESQFDWRIYGETEVKQRKKRHKPATERQSRKLQASLSAQSRETRNQFEIQSSST